MHRVFITARSLFCRRNKRKHYYDMSKWFSIVYCHRKENYRAIEPLQMSDNLDLLMKSLRTAGETGDVLSYIGKHHTIMNSSHLIQALRTIFILQKTDSSEMPIAEVTEAPNFGLLVNCLRSKARSLDVNDTIDAVKILSYLRIPASSKIMSILLQLIVTDINELSLQQLIFLEFLVKDFKSTPLVEALKIALPIVFQANLSLKVDSANAQQLADLLRYVTKRQLPRRCVDFLVDLLMRQRHSFDLKTSLTVVRSVCEYKDVEDSVRPLLHHALDTVIDYEHQCSFAAIESILQGLSNRFSQQQDYFYHEEFVQCASNSIVRKDSGFEAGAWMLRKINKFGHVNFELLDYCAKLAEAEPWALESGRLSVVLSLVHGFAIADRQPSNWSRLEPLILANVMRRTDVELPWVNLLRDLATLGTWPESLFSKVFSSSFLERFLSRGYNALDHLQLLALCQAVQSLCPNYTGPFPPADLLDKAASYNGTHVADFPLAGSLARGLGGDSFFLTGVYTRHGHFIDHLLSVNAHGAPISLAVQVKMSDDGRMYAEDALAEGRTLIAVLVLPSSSYCVNVPRLRGPIRLGLDALAANGILPITISANEWILVPDREKVPWLMRAISEKCPSLSVCNTA